MGITKKTLAKLFIVAAITGIITTSFYTYAVEAQPGQSAESSQKGQERSEKERENAAAPDNADSRVTRVKAACNKVRTSISNRTAHLQQMGDRHLGVIDKVYANLTNFANDNTLGLPGADSLVVQSAREAARMAILNLASTEDALNCEDTNASQAAASLRLQIQSVNNNLHSYRKAVEAALTTVKATVYKEPGL